MKQRCGLLVILILCQATHFFASLWMLAALAFGSRRAWRIAVGYDQLLNVVTGGNVDETISSRANRARIEGQLWGCVLCRALDLIERNHCAKSEGI